jgi:hypothetical protein
MVFMIKEEHDTVAEQFLAPIMPQWQEVFLAILKHQTQGDEERRLEEYGLKLEVVKVRLKDRCNWQIRPGLTK